MSLHTEKLTGTVANKALQSPLDESGYCVVHTLETCNKDKKFSSIIQKGHLRWIFVGRCKRLLSTDRLIWKKVPITVMELYNLLQFILFLILKKVAVNKHKIVSQWLDGQSRNTDSNTEPMFSWLWVWVLALSLS